MLDRRRPSIAAGKSANRSSFGKPLQRFRSSSGLIDQYVCGRAACADSGTPGKAGLS
jgi:hypothetical protein